MASWQLNEPGITLNEVGIELNGWGTYALISHYYTGAIHLGKQLLMRGIGF